MWADNRLVRTINVVSHKSAVSTCISEFDFCAQKTKLQENMFGHEVPLIYVFKLCIQSLDTYNCYVLFKVSNNRELNFV